MATPISTGELIAITAFISFCFGLQLGHAIGRAQR